MSTEATYPRTLFTLGRGEDARLLGAFTRFLAPSDLVRLPVGRHLFAATTPADVRDCFARFALAWDAAGLGAFARAAGPVQVPDAVPRRADWVAYEDRRDIYAFDESRWFVWIATDYPQWHHLSFAAEGGLIERPVARTYGAEHARTQDLDLTQLAAWIMGVASAQLNLTLSARVETGEATGEATIHLLVHSGHGEDPKSVSAELGAIGDACNWTNPCDPEDVRFSLCAPCIDAPGAVRPGSIVITSADHNDD